MKISHFVFQQPERSGQSRQNDLNASTDDTKGSNSDNRQKGRSNGNIGQSGGRNDQGVLQNNGERRSFKAN